MNDIITIGDVINDTFLLLDDAEILKQEHVRNQHYLICFDFGDKIPVKHRMQFVGGSAANVAVGLARLGLHSAIATTLSHEVSDQEALKTLRQEKVDYSLVHQDAKFEPHYSYVLVGPSGERTILVYHGEKGLIAHNLNWQKISSAKWIYLGPMPARSESVLNELVKAAKAGTKIAYNPGIVQIKKGIEYLSQIFRHTEILILNREEAARLVGKSDESIDNLLKSLYNYGSKVVVITDGPNGASAFDGMNIKNVIAAKESRKVDTTGAGDAFSAGFVAATIKGHHIEEALDLGVKNGAAVVAQFGAQTGLLKHDQI